MNLTLTIVLLYITMLYYGYLLHCAFEISEQNIALQRQVPNKNSQESTSVVQRLNSRYWRINSPFMKNSGKLEQRMASQLTQVDFDKDVKGSQSAFALFGSVNHLPDLQ